jgi:Ni/Fe-hydrogenase subunit HybB-like protein
LAARGFRRPIETRILGKLSGVTALLLAGYLVVRFADLIVRGQLGAAFAANLDAGMFWLENVLFVLALVLLARPAYRTNPRMMFIAAVLLVAVHYQSMPTSSATIRRRLELLSLGYRDLVTVGMFLSRSCSICCSSATAGATTR